MYMYLTWRILRNIFSTRNPYKETVHFNRFILTILQDTNNLITKAKSIPVVIWELYVFPYINLVWLWKFNYIVRHLNHQLIRSDNIIVNCNVRYFNKKNPKQNKTMHGSVKHLINILRTWLIYILSSYPNLRKKKKTNGDLLRCTPHWICPPKLQEYPKYRFRPM